MYTIADINYMIAGPFLTLDILYLVFAVVALLRLYTVYQIRDRFVLGIYFYLMIAVHCLYRVATFQVTTVISIRIINDADIQGISDTSKLIAILLYSSDITFWIIFLLFFWQLVVLLYVGHIKSNSLTFNPEPAKPPPLRKSAVQVFFTLVAIYLAFQIIIISLFEKERFSINVYILINAIGNLTVPICIGMSEAYYHHKFSGLPYKSLFFQRRKRKLNLRIVYWAFGRTLHGVLDLVILNFKQVSTYVKFPANPNEVSDYDYAMMTISILIIIISALLFEIIPFLLVFDMDFVRVFFKIDDNEIEDLNDDLIEKNIGEAQKTWNSLQNDLHQTFANNEPANKSSVFVNRPAMNSKNSTFIEKEGEVPRIPFSCLRFQAPKSENQKKNGVGEIGVAIISELAAVDDLVEGSFLSMSSTGNERVTTRRIGLSGLSPYLTEEIMNDLKTHYRLQCDPELNLAILKGYALHENELFLVFEDYTHGSLSSLLSRNSDQSDGLLSFNLKAKLATQIAKSLKKLHSLNPPLIHGHLSTLNILLDAEFFPKISDLCFAGLKKFLAVSRGYTTKSAFSAPEVLKEGSPIPTNPRAAADVYSFGMILWEVFVEKQPFKGIKLKDLRKIVVEENSRPKIPEFLPVSLANLIRCCWQQDKEKRPNFTEISENLESHFLFKHDLSNSSALIE